MTDKIIGTFYNDWPKGDSLTSTDIIQKSTWQAEINIFTELEHVNLTPNTKTLFDLGTLGEMRRLFSGETQFQSRNSL